MNTIKLYAVHNGYEIIGYASNFEEIKNNPQKKLVIHAKGFLKVLTITVKMNIR